MIIASLPPPSLVEYTDIYKQFAIEVYRLYQEMEQTVCLLLNFYFIGAFEVTILFNSVALLDSLFVIYKMLIC
jgi:hypothetical protein